MTEFPKFTEGIQGVQQSFPKEYLESVNHKMSHRRWSEETSVKRKVINMVWWRLYGSKEDSGTQYSLSL